MTDADLEPAARRLCEIRGIDPDSDGHWIYEFGNEAGWRCIPMWKTFIPELRAHLKREQALRETIAKPQEGGE